MTQLGLIPENWEVKRLTSFAKIQAGATPSTTNPEYWGGKIRWMNSGELNFKKIYEVANRITEKGLKSSSTKVLPVNCVLIGLAGQGKTRGTVAINKVQLCTNQSVAAILPNESFEPEYIYYNLDSRYKELRQLSIGDGGRGGLNLKLIGSLKLPLPPISEQKAIVKILSTWDEAIEKTRLLIEQKELRKKALMQQLLTGKKRLQGFTYEWKEVCLGSLGSTYSGLTGKSKGDFGSGKPYIPYLNIFNNYSINPTYFDLVEIENNENQNRVIFGDILFTVSSETPDEVGMAAVMLSDIEELYLNSFCFGFRLHNYETLIPQFCSYFFRAEKFRKEVWTLAQGATRYNISKKALMKLTVSIPIKEEQKAIAEILQKADDEIRLEKQILEQLRLQKKALMQVLLTGRKRVNYECN